jgi:hypothetical protein
MKTQSIEKEKWEIFKENYLVNDDEGSDHSPDIEEDPFDRIEILSPFISHVKIKKAIMKASIGFMDEFNEVKFGEVLTEENYWTAKRLLIEIKKCDHKVILGNALALLEVNGLIDCVCYILELGKYIKRGRVKPNQLRKRKLPTPPDINEL